MIKIPKQESFNKIKSLCNKYLEELKKDKEIWPGCNSDPINWGDLKCVEVLFCLTESNEVIWQILVEEVSPTACNLRAYLYERFKLDGFENIDVKTEW